MVRLPLDANQTEQKRALDWIDETNRQYPRIWHRVYQTHGDIPTQWFEHLYQQHVDCIEEWTNIDQWKNRSFEDMNELLMKYREDIYPWVGIDVPQYFQDRYISVHGDKKHDIDLECQLEHRHIACLCDTNGHGHCITFGHYHRFLHHLDHKPRLEISDNIYQHLWDTDYIFTRVRICIGLINTEIERVVLEKSRQDDGCICNHSFFGE